MYAVGHIAISYIIGKASSRILKLKVNIPLLFALSIIPDIDFVIPYLNHRGLTHSLFLTAITTLPFLIAYKKNVIPYMLAVTQHIVIGDFLTGGVQLFSPLNLGWYGLKIHVSSLLNITVEWIAVLASITLMLKTKDFQKLLKPHILNLTFIIPITAICLPMFIGFPIRVPLTLIIPHLTYLTIFMLSILRDFKAHL